MKYLSRFALVRDTPFGAGSEREKTAGSAQLSTKNKSERRAKNKEGATTQKNKSESGQC